MTDRFAALPGCAQSYVVELEDDYEVIRVVLPEGRRSHFSYWVRIWQWVRFCTPDRSSWKSPADEWANLTMRGKLMMYDHQLCGCATRLEIAEEMAAHWAAFVRDGTLRWDGPTDD